MDTDENFPKTRVICLVDVDSFEVQVYDKIYPQYTDRPRIVASRGRGHTDGRIVAVDYMAKRAGVTRQMKVKEARRQCRDLKVIWKDERWGKPDALTPRHASWKILDEILKFCKTFGHQNITVEYASSDEFYFDFSKEVEYRMKNKALFPVNPFENFHLEGGSRKFKGSQINYRLNVVYPTNYKKYETEARLIYGGMIAQQLCEHIFDEIGYRVSAGVSSNKLLAKLACPVHKPGGVTVLPRVGLERINGTIMIEDIPGLGGAYGKKIKERFDATSMRHLSKIPQSQLRKFFEDDENASRFYDLGQGYCDNVVTNKTMKDEVSCSKTGIGHAFGDKLMEHLFNLVGEMLERLEEEKRRHKRRTNSLQIRCEFWKKSAGSFSATFDLPHILFTKREVASRAYDLLEEDSRIETKAIKVLKLTAKNFMKLNHLD